MISLCFAELVSADLSDLACSETLVWEQILQKSSQHDPTAPDRKSCPSNKITRRRVGGQMNQSVAL